MLNKIKGLSDKTLLIIGLTFILIAITFAIVVGVIFEIPINGWKNFVYDFVYFILYAVAFLFLVSAYDKKRKIKDTLDKK